MPTTEPQPFHVAIIGAGLSGLTLALALHQQNIPSTIYESRPAPLNIGGAVMLSPNALRVLDALGLYHSPIKPQGYSFDVLHFRSAATGDLTETYEFGDEEKYGYRALRIYRHVLITALLDEIEKNKKKAEEGSSGIEIRFGRKFTHVVEDTMEGGNGGGSGVTFALDDGTTQTASLLVGADGIHSRVRKYLYPDLPLRFIGMAGITAAVPTSQLALPQDYHIPVTLVSPTHGAFVVAPQEPDGSEVLIGKQRRVDPELVRDRAAWERFTGDKADAVRFLKAGNEVFGDIAENATSRIDNPDKVNIWPFFVVPRLERWTSPSRRVIILGDAAHAIPPSAGQGINQAFEDVYMLALLLKGAGVATEEGSEGRKEKSLLREGLAFWQAYRQERIDRILELNKQIDMRRMPSDDAVIGEGSGAVREEFDLEWLYKPDFKGVVDEWISQQ